VSFWMMGLGQNVLTWVRSVHFFGARIWFGLPPLGLENFLKSPKFFNFLLSGQKNLIMSGQKISALKPDQKYAHFGSGQGSISSHFDSKSWLLHCNILFKFSLLHFSCLVINCQIIKNKSFLLESFT